VVPGSEITVRPGNKCRKMLRVDRVGSKFILSVASLSASGITFLLQSVGSQNLTFHGGGQSKTKKEGQENPKIPNKIFSFK